VSGARLLRVSASQLILGTLDPHLCHVDLFGSELVLLTT
jgi:hypothetical protein